MPLLLHVSAAHMETAYEDVPLKPIEGDFKKTSSP